MRANRPDDGDEMIGRPIVAVVALELTQVHVLMGDPGRLRLGINVVVILSERGGR